MLAVELFKSPLAISPYEAFISPSLLKHHYTSQVLMTVAALPDDAASAAVLEGFCLPCDDGRRISRHGDGESKTGQCMISLVPALKGRP